MKYSAETKNMPLRLAVVVALASWHTAALAQDATAVPEPTIEEQEATAGIDEVVVTGRFISSSQQLINERMDDAFATDLLGADTIARLGDSTVASALRRIPGLTLVQDKFVYIRGLGERYSSTTLNGAQIPSPDLTRNVIPLDVFPTSVVESLRVQKSYSPALSANFGGGAVDIRTRGIPDGFTLKFEAGVGLNSENPSNIQTYTGGGDDVLGTDDGGRALSPVITDALVTYQGQLDARTILGRLQRENPDATIAEAQAINRSLALELNRDISVQNTSTEPDYAFRGSVGNKFEVGTDWELGFAVGGSYQQQWRWRRALRAAPGNREQIRGVKEETTRSVNMAGTLNLGLNYLRDHEFETTTLWLRNTDDETEIFDFENENRNGNEGFRDTRLEFEERNMLTNQIRGTHYLGSETRERFGFIDWLATPFPEETRIDWFYSESNAETDIPNRVRVANQNTTIDPETGEVTGSFVAPQPDAALHRFVDLEDEVENYGWNGLLPLSFGNNYVELSGGYAHSQKSRQFLFSEFSVGVPGTNRDQRTGPLGDVFADEIIVDPANNAEISRTDLRDSYIAATMTDAAFGAIDWTWNDTWRFAAGARWEDYRQAAVPWNPYSFNPTAPQINLVDSAGRTPDDPDFNDAEFVFAEDKWYPSVALTYIGDLWAETFQVRLGYSETTVRPDLREITNSSYSDPVTDQLTRGNPGVVPSDVENLDLRFEWFFGNGDNFTVTGFTKDIEKPIAFFFVPASDTTIARSIQNAVSAEVSGVEIEGLKELGFLGGFFDMFFVQGNLTLQDSEMLPGDPATGEGSIDVTCLSTEGTSITGNDCQLPGASDYVLNLMLGFDSPNSRHTASLIYNVFGERVFSLTRRQGTSESIPDVVEEPFESLDFTYFWYPTDRVTFKAKVQNILGSSVELTTGGLTVFEEDPGTSYSMTLSWGF
jgi:outer membrane receptor protein involved in Fe transport